jgi:hypothetical protein
LAQPTTSADPLVCVTWQQHPDFYGKIYNYEDIYKIQKKLFLPDWYCLHYCIPVISTDPEKDKNSL